MELLAQINPDYLPATWKEIKAKRDELESSPITLSNGYTYDYNEKTEIRLVKALKRFDELPSVVAHGALPWKLSDNTYHLHSKVEFQQVVEEIDAAIADRSDRLFAKAEELALNPPTVAELNDPSTWNL